MQGEQVDQDAEVAPPAEHVRRLDWRLGGRTTARWNERLLAVALLSLGVGVVVGALVERLAAGSWGSPTGTAILWVSMIVPVIWGFARSRPIGLLRFEAVDVVWGLGIGILLRIVQGWLAAAGGDTALPSYPTIGGGLPIGWWFDGVLAPVLIAPTIEEFFFRGVVLVSVFTIVRRTFGGVAAAVVAIIGSTGLFVFVHALTLSLGVADVLSLTALGLATGAIVLLTGRIWSAVLVHIVYNATFVVLALAGTYVR
jgi:membrane protease YdiL (CAAX protease family)